MAKSIPKPTLKEQASKAFRQQFSSAVRRSRFGVAQTEAERRAGQKFVKAPSARQMFGAAMTPAEKKALDRMKKKGK